MFKSETTWNCLLLVSRHDGHDAVVIKTQSLSALSVSLSVIMPHGICGMSLESSIKLRVVHLKLFNSQKF